jgi:CBS domain-containing protein
MNTSKKKTTPAGDANPNARPVKDVIKPAKAVLGKASVSVQTALEEMQAQGIDSAPVTNQRGELLGTVSSNEMNRKVGGLGHDPKTEPVEGQVEKKNVYCFEDQTVAQAEQIMCDAKVAELPVVTREKLLLGTTNLEAIAQDNDREDPRTSGKRLYSKKTFFAVFMISGGLLLAYALLLRRYSVLRLYKAVS